MSDTPATNPEPGATAAQTPGEDVKATLTAASSGSIQAFSCLNNGGFDIYLEARYLDANGKTQPYGPITPSGVPVNQRTTLPLGPSGIATGQTCWIYIDVIWGKDNQGTEMFTYDPNGGTANYYISGATLDNHLHYSGITS